MYSLINTNINRTYNPKQNALSDIKRLLTSRDTATQTKACGYIHEVISRYSRDSEEGMRIIEYLLDNDITVFLCEATANLDFILFRSILSCLRLLWRSRRFFSEEHAAHSLTAVLRTLTHYCGSGPAAAFDTCLNFLGDLLDGITTHKTTPALSHQSAYSAVQLLSCLNSVPTPNSNTILSSALVLHSLIAYQPDNVIIKSDTAVCLVRVVGKWFELLTGSLNRAVLVEEDVGMFYVVACELGMNSLRLTSLLKHDEHKVNFVESILTDDQEINELKKCAIDLFNSIQRLISDLVVFTKEHVTQIQTEEYMVFLKFLLNFFSEKITVDVLPDFCDMLFSMGYLTMLPQTQIIRNDTSIRKASTLLLGEILKVLSDKYLNVNNTASTCANDINMGFVELQYGIERPQTIGAQLQKRQSCSLLIYLYFHCQSIDNPNEATAHLLPHLVEYILKLPNSAVLPPYIVKALWLVFAMSSLSNGTLQSLDERVYLEKATHRLTTMLSPDPSIYYTHNPALLLWCFTSQRISDHVKFHVLSQWLKLENSLPTELTTKPAIWELLLNILVQCKIKVVVENCMECLHLFLNESDDEEKDNFAKHIWSMLPNVLSKALIDCHEMDTNITNLLDLSTMLLPTELDPTTCLKTAVLITAIFTRKTEDIRNDRSHFEYVCLKLSLYLLGMAHNQNDNRVLLIYVNRTGFLPSVLLATNSSDDRLACAALQFLSYVVHYFTKNGYQPKSVLQIQTDLIIKYLRKDGNTERGASILQLVHMVLNSGVNTPLALTYEIEENPSAEQQCNSLRTLMFRIQLMLCCRESKTQSSAGWKTLSAVFKHAIVNKKDTNLIATLTSQPWTHMLIQFQITQHITPEFLRFIHNWLTLLNITIKTSQEEHKIQLNKHSLIIKTMGSLRKLKVEDDLKETSQKINVIVKEIIDNTDV